MKDSSKEDIYRKTLEELYLKKEQSSNSKGLKQIAEEFTKKDKDEKLYLDEKEYLEHLRKLLAAEQKVTNEDLINLSKKRVENILEYLIKNKKVDKNSIKVQDIAKQDKIDLKWAVFKFDVATK